MPQSDATGSATTPAIAARTTTPASAARTEVV